MHVFYKQCSLPKVFYKIIFISSGSYYPHGKDIMKFRKMFTFGLVVLITISGLLVVFNSAEGFNGELDKKDEKILDPDSTEIFDAIKENGDVITSSPSPISKDFNATSKADVPFATALE